MLCPTATHHGPTIPVRTRRAGAIPTESRSANKWESFPFRIRGWVSIPGGPVCLRPCAWCRRTRECRRRPIRWRRLRRPGVGVFGHGCTFRLGPRRCANPVRIHICAGQIVPPAGFEPATPALIAAVDTRVGPARPVPANYVRRGPRDSATSDNSSTHTHWLPDPNRFAPAARWSRAGAARATSKRSAVTGWSLVRAWVASALRRRGAYPSFMTGGGRGGRRATVGPLLKPANSPVCQLVCQLCAVRACPLMFA